jgi:hypothetical protein
MQAMLPAIVCLKVGKVDDSYVSNRAQPLQLVPVNLHNGRRAARDTVCQHHERHGMQNNGNRGRD